MEKAVGNWKILGPAGDTDRRSKSLCEYGLGHSLPGSLEDLQVPDVFIKQLTRKGFEHPLVRHSLKVEALLPYFAEKLGLAEELLPILDYRLGDPASTDAEPYIAARYLPNASLPNYFRQFANKPLLFAFEARLKIISEAARKAGLFHAYEFVHGDIKLDNILLRDDQVWLVDWGLAHIPEKYICRYLQCNTPAMLFPDKESPWSARWSEGTPAFSAPESASKPPYHPTQDVYALGASLAYIFLAWQTEELDRSFDSEKERFREFIFRDFAHKALGNEQMAEFLCQIVCRAIAWDPTSRYQNGTVMHKDLELVLQAVSDLKKEKGELLPLHGFE